MASLGSLLAAVTASPEGAKRDIPGGNAGSRRSSAPPDAIRDPVGLALYAQRRGQVKPGKVGLLRALWAAVHAMREAARPAAMFWHLLRVDPVRWCRARDDDDAARLLRTVRMVGA